jgi:membrane protease YdiL (CAAX protease family)
LSARQRVRAAGWSFVFLLGGYALALAVLLVAQRFIRRPAPGSLREAGIEALALLASYAALTWLIGFRVLKLTRAEFGLPSRGAHSVRGTVGFRGFGWGLLLGVVIAALAMLLAVPLGHAAWRTDGGTVPQWLGRVVLTGLVLLPAALAEELAFRGAPLLALGKQFGRVPAILVLALLFGVAHLDNEAVTLLALGNIAIAGVLLGVAFFTSGGLLTSTGLHFGWNLALAGLAAPVSGTTIPMPWLDYSAGGPRWLTGGVFGPEGGALASLCLLSGVFLALRRRRKESRA